VIISTLGWIIIGVAAWLVVAAIVGVIIGRSIRQRDAHVPFDDVDSPLGSDAPADPLNTDPFPRTTGRDRPRRG
jgi:hypothetical protein